MKKVKGLKGEKVKGAGSRNMKAMVAKTHQALKQRRARKRYYVMAFQFPGASYFGYGWAEWSESFEQNIFKFPCVCFCWIVRVKIPMWKIDGSRAPSEEDIGVFKSCGEAIKFIRECEGGVR